MSGSGRTGLNALSMAAALVVGEKVEVLGVVVI